MELKTDLFTEELVTDVAIGFPSGTVKDFVLRNPDVFREEHHQIIIILENLGGSGYPETIKFSKAHIAWFSVMKRIMRRAIKKAADGSTGTGFAETTV